MSYLQPHSEIRLPVRQGTEKSRLIAALRDYYKACGSVKTFFSRVASLAKQAAEVADEGNVVSLGHSNSDTKGVHPHDAKAAHAGGLSQGSRRVDIAAAHTGGMKAAAIIIFGMRTHDGRDWASVTVKELVGYKRDGGIADRVLTALNARYANLDEIGNEPLSALFDFKEFKKTVA